MHSNHTSENFNHLQKTPDTLMMFIDMNSFFASCEQQVNYFLRHRPIGVCVYTSKYGCVIAPSIEAKKRGVKLGMRLNEVMKICPDFVPVEMHSQRYRNFHIQIMNVLQKYCDEVIPKSIDEAVMNLSTYKNIYKDPDKLAKQIKADIQKDVGDWFKCSIGIAPNGFLAKLATDIQKPDGLVKIMPDTIDAVLGKLQLTDLPGISKGMYAKLERIGITTPLQLRYAKPDFLKAGLRSVVGLYWHYRLNFAEVDMATQDYKGMQAMRQISKQQRESTEKIEELLLTLCMTLEKRMVTNNFFAKEINMSAKYENGFSWHDKVAQQRPIQDGTEILDIVKSRMKKFQETNHCVH